MRAITVLLLLFSYGCLHSQEFRCIYYSLQPVLQTKSRTNSDYFISTVWYEDSIAISAVLRLESDSIQMDSIEVQDIVRNFRKVSMGNVDYCLVEARLPLKINFILSTRNYMPSPAERRMEKDISSRVLSELEFQSAENNALFFNLGKIYFYDPTGFYLKKPNRK